MKTTLELLRELIKKDLSTGKTETEIAHKVGVSQGTIYKYLHTDTSPGVESLKKFSKAYAVPISMLVNVSSHVAEPLVSYGSTAIVREIPVINGAACGNWRDFTDLEYPSGAADRFEPANTNDVNAFYVIAKGDSMIGGDIKDGDLLLIEPNREWHDGNIVLAKSKDGCTVKLIFRHKDSIELRPLNPAHKSLIVRDDEGFIVMRVSSYSRKL